MVAGTLRRCHHDVCQQECIGVTTSAVNGSRAGTTEVRNLSTLTTFTLTLSVMASSGFYCYEGGCIHEQPPRLFSSQKSLRQHQNRCHKGTKGEGSSMGRALKRRGNAIVAEEEKRRRLEEACIGAKVTCHTLELAPVWLFAWYCSVWIDADGFPGN